MNSHLRNAAALTGGLLATLALAVPAGAQDADASATGTVSVGIRSVTVSPATFNFDECSLAGTPIETLAFPNGQCRGPQLTVANGEAASHIYVRATDFQGSAGGPPWDLSGSTSPRPGAEQAALVLFDPPILILSNDDRCDPSWDNQNSDPAAKCAADADQSVQERLALIGPTSTVNMSPSFSTTITWTALP